MLAALSEKAIYLGGHGKPSPMKLAPKILAAPRFVSMSVSVARANSASKVRAGFPPGAPRNKSPNRTMQCPRKTCATPRCARFFTFRLEDPSVRVHLSNAFGTEALHFTAVHIARPVSPASAASIHNRSSAHLRMESRKCHPARSRIHLRPGRLSGRAALRSGSDLPSGVPTGDQTGHPGSRATSYTVNGNEVNAAHLHKAKHVDHWYQVSEIDVPAARKAGVVVALG